jgi:hypothetical protein
VRRQQNKDQILPTTSIAHIDPLLLVCVYSSTKSNTSLRLPHKVQSARLLLQPHTVAGLGAAGYGKH